MYHLDGEDDILTWDEAVNEGSLPPWDGTTEFTEETIIKLVDYVTQDVYSLFFIIYLYFAFSLIEGHSVKEILVTRRRKLVS